MVMLILGATLNLGVGENFPTEPLSREEKVSLYQQARLTPGARQIGLSCAFYANVPLVTMSIGINIADGSVASKEFVASIYALRRGEFQFMSAFDREMFFELFHIPAKGVEVYYREAARGELLADAEEIITHDLAAALDLGQFFSLRVLGEFGGPHNVLLLAHKSGNYYYHDPRSGRIKTSPSAELASKILTVSKARSKTKKRYFSSYHLVALPVPTAISADFRTPLDFPKKLEIELTPEQENSITVSLKREDGGEGVAASFPEVDFATKGEDAVSVIAKSLNEGQLLGVYNLTKLALNSFHLGKREFLPVLLLDRVPFVVTGYADGEKAELILSDGNSNSVIGLVDALEKFKKSGCFLGYVKVAKK